MIENKKRWALLSVSDKTGIVEFAKRLKNLGFGVLSTGGTAIALRAGEVGVVDVSEYTGFPELMEGRLKTLHPKIHGGILGRRNLDESVMEEHSIEAIDIVAVNLYPFSATIARQDCTFDEAVENIDIGGPTMIRAAAKNHAAVAVICDPIDYDSVAIELEELGSVSDELRYGLATKAFGHTSKYDQAIYTYLNKSTIDSKELFPKELSIDVSLNQTLRYGENPHQKAAFYKDKVVPKGSLASALQVQGKELSYNNIADTDAALDMVRALQGPACCIVKHANPCGVAEATDLMTAYKLAFETDPTSAFGGIIAFNQILTGSVASAVIERQFVEVIIAPEIEADAVTILQSKPNVRVLSTGAWEAEPFRQMEYKRVMGGILVQDRDYTAQLMMRDDLKVVSKRRPTVMEIEDMLFAWRVAACVKSNAIVYAKDKRTIGVGAGQMSRIYSARIAAIKAEDEGLVVKGSVMASDAFFPFRDGIDAAAESGIVAVIQPGGSMRDDEVIAAADENDMAMVFTGERHFRH